MSQNNEIRMGWNPGEYNILPGVGGSAKSTFARDRMLIESLGKMSRVKYNGIDLPYGVIDHMSFIDPGTIGPSPIAHIAKDIHLWEEMSRLMRDTFKIRSFFDWGHGHDPLEQLKRDDYAKYLQEKARLEKDRGFHIRARRREPMSPIALQIPSAKCMY
jgi:hypothetical protein